jgi:hypothetical protein
MIKFISFKNLYCELCVVRFFYIIIAHVFYFIYYRKYYKRILNVKKFIPFLRIRKCMFDLRLLKSFNKQIQNSIILLLQ